MVTKFKGYFAGIAETNLRKVVQQSTNVATSTQLNLHGETSCWGSSPEGLFLLEY